MSAQPTPDAPLLRRMREVDIDRVMEIVPELREWVIERIARGV